MFVEAKIICNAFLRFITMLFFIAGYAYTAAQNNFYFGDSAYHQKVARSKMDNKHKRDSLLNLAAAMPQDSNKVLVLLSISDLQADDSATGSIAYALQAKELSQKLHYKPGIARALGCMGTVYQRKKDYNTAIDFFLKAIEEGEKYEHFSLKDNLYPLLLNLYFYLGDYPGAMKASAKGLAAAEKINDKKEIALFYNLLGYINCKQGNLDESKKYYDQYLQLARVLNDSLMQGHAYSEAAEVFVNEKKILQAMDYLFSSQKIYQSLIEKYTGKENDLFNYANFAAVRLVKVNYQLGKVYKIAGRLDSALFYSLPSVESSKYGISNNYDVASYYINAGDIYRLLGNHTKAIELLRAGLYISVDIQHKENERDACEALALIYREQKKYDSAFIFYSRFTDLKDSIVNNETRMKIAEVQGQYDVAKKDKEISRQQQIRNILIGCFAFLLVSLAFLYNRYRLRQKNKYQQSINRQQNELFNAIVTTQDQERKRIAQDLHDGLGSVLSAAKLKLSALEESNELLPPGLKEKYQTTLLLLDEAAAELRNVSHNIMPATLSKLGLVAALKNLIDHISSHSGLQISFSAHGFTNRLNEVVEMSIYRVVLELINNIVKHAAAQKVTLQMIQYPDYINITVEDDGKGFNYEAALDQKKGIGLGNILSRVEYLKGKIEVDSAGKGTTTIIDIPI